MMHEQVDALREQAQTLEDLAQSLRNLANAVEGVCEILDYSREQQSRPKPRPTACTECGMTYSACTDRVLGRHRQGLKRPGKACCEACCEEDTHGLAEAGLL